MKSQRPEIASLFPKGLWATALLAALLTGCTGYRLGTMLPASIQTIFIPTFENDTNEPLIEMDATRAAIAEIQRDGSLKLVKDEKAADAILSVRLRSFDLNPLAYDRSSKARPNEYRIILVASLVLTDAKTGKVLVEYGAARGEANIVVAGDMTTAKRTGLPAVSRDLAHKIVERVVEAW